MKWSEFWKFKAQIPSLTLNQIEVIRLVLDHYAKEKRGGKNEQKTKTRSRKKAG